MTEIKCLVFVLELHLQQIFDVDLRDVVHDESETVLRKQLQKNKTIRDCFWLSLDVIRRVSGRFHSASRATRHALMFGQVCLHHDSFFYDFLPQTNHIRFKHCCTIRKNRNKKYFLSNTQRAQSATFQFLRIKCIRWHFRHQNEANRFSTLAVTNGHRNGHTSG